MELINEVYVKKLINEGKLQPKGSITATDNQVFTPSAIEYLNDKNIRIIKQNETVAPNEQKTFETVFS